jgi:hypothetical protein
VNLKILKAVELKTGFTGLGMFLDRSFKQEIKRYSDYQISVLLPLFPFNDLISFDFLKDEDFKDPLWQICNPKVEPNFFDINGPLELDNSSDIPIMRTTSDGFKWKSASFTLRYVTKITNENKLDIVVKKFGDISWKSLSREELDYFSTIIFSSEVDIYKYLIDSSYQHEVST